MRPQRGSPGAERFLVPGPWRIPGSRLTTVMNELSRSMGQPDFHPFRMPHPVLRKLHFIHLVTRDQTAYAGQGRRGVASRG